jgi:2-polyprenyl-6-methoxyphenol hydroxylase-like FAD-dependent oxidoreductase
MTQRSRKALIIGAGIAGSITAILLRKIGIAAELFETWPHATGIGGGLQIAPNGMHVLAEAGLAGDMIRRGAVCKAIDFYSQSGVPLGTINRDLERRFGAPAVNMRRATLNEAILAKAEHDGIAVQFEKRLVRIEDRADRPIVAHFADGSSAEGDFLIGADGVHSAVRNHVIPDGPKPFDTGLVSFGGFVPRSILEAVDTKPRLAMTFGQSGFFGYGFCTPEPDHGAMCWSTQPVHGIDATTFRAMDQAALRRHLRTLHAGWHDPVPGIVAAMDEITVTATLDVATLPTWSRGRTLLIGDAAHAASPHAGQGASLALEDAMRLARLLGAREDIGVTFEQFERERRPRAERIVALARRNGNHKREYGRAGAWLRDRMLKLMLPLNGRTEAWMYGYDPRAVAPGSNSRLNSRLASRPGTPSPHARRAA